MSSDRRDPGDYPDKVNEIESVVIYSATGKIIECSSVEKIPIEEVDPDLFEGVIIKAERAAFRVWPSGCRPLYSPSEGDTMKRRNGDEWVIVRSRKSMLSFECGCLKRVES